MSFWHNNLYESDFVMCVCCFCPTLNILRAGTTSHLFISVSLSVGAHRIVNQQFFFDSNPLWLPINVYCNSSSPSLCSHLSLSHPTLNLSQFPPLTLNLQCPEHRDNSINKTFCLDGHVLHLCCPRWQPLATWAIEHLQCGSFNWRTEILHFISF